MYCLPTYSLVKISYTAPASDKHNRGIVTSLEGRTLHFPGAEGMLRGLETVHDKHTGLTSEHKSG